MFRQRNRLPVDAMLPTVGWLIVWRAGNKQNIPLDRRICPTLAGAQIAAVVATNGMRSLSHMDVEQGLPYPAYWPSVVQKTNRSR
jgi:hypothetical protein